MSEIQGLKELQAAFAAIPEQFQRNILRGAMRQAAKVVAEQAKALAPVAPPTKRNAKLYHGRAGALRDSIRFDTMVDGTKVIGYVRAGPRTNQSKKEASAAYYARWVEYGTAAHLIAAGGNGKKARQLNRQAMKANVPVASLVINGQFVGPTVMHPGSKPHPFLRPALERAREDAVQAAQQYIARRLRQNGLNTPEVEE